MLQSEYSILKDRLREALTKALPGEIAHRLMLPPGRELFPVTGKTTMVPSSVLMLIFPDNSKLHTCLIKRPASMRNHGGQLAFPGGRYEHSDKDLLQTALRESFEEIGTNEHELDIIGALTPIYVEVSNFTINPFIGWCDTLPQFRVDKREVDELLTIPIEKFLLQTTFDYRSVITPRGNLEVPGFYIDPHFIWGATAMILSEFREIYGSITAPG